MSEKQLFQLLPAIDVQIFTIALTKELKSDVRDKAAITRVGYRVRRNSDPNRKGE